MEQIVILNRAKAEIYKYSPDEGFNLLTSLENPLGRLQNKEMQTDKRGMSRAKYKNAAPHKLTGEKRPNEEATEQFAQQVGEALQLEMKRDHDLTLKIAAEPKMLGKIKKVLVNGNNGIKKRVSWVDKDLNNVPQKDWPRSLDLSPLKTPQQIGARFPTHKLAEKRAMS